MKGQLLNLFLSLFYINYAISKKKKKIPKQKDTNSYCTWADPPCSWTRVIDTEHIHAETEKKKVIYKKKQKQYTLIILHKDANTSLH